MVGAFYFPFILNYIIMKQKCLWVEIRISRNTRWSNTANQYHLLSGKNFVWEIWATARQSVGEQNIRNRIFIIYYYLEHSCSRSAPDPPLVITHPKDDVFWPVWAHLSNPEPPAQCEQSSHNCKVSQKDILPLCFIRGKRWRNIGICSLDTITSAAGLSLITSL